MDTVIHHVGISTLTILGSAALTAAAFVNPVGAGIFAVGFATWLYERNRA